MGKIDLSEEGYEHVTLFGDGRLAVLIQQGSNAQIRLGLDPGGYEEAYSYKTYLEAKRALRNWSGAPGTEPRGWIRHQPSNRRRTDGDPETEHIRA